MSKALIISALVCAVASHVVSEERDDVNSIKYHPENPVTFISDGYLFTLRKTNTSIHLNSTKENFTPCSITVDPVKDFGMIIQGKKLPNHKFIVWGYRSYNSNSSAPHRQGIVSVKYTALIVDPSSCTYKDVDIPEDKIRNPDWPVFYSQVVPLNDGFDFFSPGLGNCLPCRFSFEGKSVPLTYQLAVDQYIPPPYMYNIQSVNNVDTSKGYIYTAIFGNETAVIKKLDGKFQVVKQAFLKHPIHSLSTNDMEQPVISVCYASQSSADSFRRSNFSVYCEQLDSDFNSKFTVRLPVPGDRFVFGFLGITHQVDSLGNIFIGLIQHKISESTFMPETRQIRLFMYEKTGKLVDTNDFEEVNMDTGLEISELRSHLTVDKKFCIVFHLAYFKDSPSLYNDVNELIKCLDVSKYVK